MNINLYFFSRVLALQLSPQTGEDYLKEALASSIFNPNPESKSKLSVSEKKAKDYIQRGVNAENVFVQTEETLKASEVLGCDDPIVEYADVCDTLSNAMIAFTISLKK